MNEIIICCCGSEKELYYSDETVVHETCKCKKVKLDKPLDKAILKLTEILNESNFSRTSKSAKSI